jgi:hypothetical protein
MSNVAPPSRFVRIAPWILGVLVLILAVRYIFLLVGDPSDGASWFALVCWAIAAVGLFSVAIAIGRKSRA